MKTTEVKMRTGEVLFRDLTLVNVKVADGIHGWGDAGQPRRERAFDATELGFEHYVVGQVDGVERAPIDPDAAATFLRALRATLSPARTMGVRPGARRP